MIDGRTGRLCEPEPREFAAALKELVEEAQDPKKRAEVADRCNKHVKENFAFDAFAARLDEVLRGE